MEEQLPIPLSELVVLNLFLGSVTYVLGVVYILVVLRANHNIRWMNTIIICTSTIGLGLISSLLLWVVRPTTYDLMVGPIHIPTFIGVFLVSTILLLLFGNKIRLIQNRNVSKT